MGKPLTAFVIALLIPVLSVQAASAKESRTETSAVAWSQLTTATRIWILGNESGHSSPAKKPRANTSAVAWSQLTTAAQVWILGNQIHAYECLAKETRATLSLQSPDGWVEVARSVSRLDPQLCATSTLPYAAKYAFTLTVDGQRPFPVSGSHATLLVYQVTYTQGSSLSGVSAVYADSDEASEDQLDGKLPSVGVGDVPEQQIQTLITPQPLPSKSKVTPVARPTSSARASVGWRGCSFNGVPMFGRVKVVSVGARFKVRFVGGNAKLRVKGVTRPANRCGQWQFVSASPAFTIEIVGSGEDFTVSLGAAHPGVAN